MKKIEDNTTLVSIVDVRANKHQMKQAVKKPYDIVVAKDTWNPVSVLLLAEALRPQQMRQSDRRDALESRTAPEMTGLSILQLRTCYSLARGGRAAAVNSSRECSAELVSEQPLEK
ncbi:hypothetical protein MG293_004815 [Ovis ammon polii]|uniref:Uncharacterized protein n=1 Tax=Ovis ammon polii TaxID=230172 RepID=A0AAD4UIU4_OVIAM|nr:hypothetical protein MG293_004815 [Ovis ammon polii]KAI4574631.1 hypothetical protein MJT46_003910 [Ovis ammon polii x Ovis aries]